VISLLRHIFTTKPDAQALRNADLYDDPYWKTRIGRRVMAHHEAQALVERKRLRERFYFWRWWS